MSLSDTRVEILQTANQLRPTLLEARFSQWERMGLAGGRLDDMVSGTRPLTIPVDKDGTAGDTMDKKIRTARRETRQAYAEAVMAIQRALVIQEAWIHLDAEGNDITIHVATKEDREKASDNVDCLACSEPIVGSPRSGFCNRDWMAWSRDGKPDRVLWIKTRRIELEVAEAMEA